LAFALSGAFTFAHGYAQILREKIENYFLQRAFVAETNQFP
jgi:hypothetical protein